MKTPKKQQKKHRKHKKDKKDKEDKKDGSGRAGQYQIADASTSIPLNEAYANIALDDYEADGYVQFFNKDYPGLQCVHWDRQVGRPARNASMVFIVNRFLSAAECQQAIQEAEAAHQQELHAC